MPTGDDDLHGSNTSDAEQEQAPAVAAPDKLDWGGGWVGRGGLHQQNSGDIINDGGDDDGEGWHGGRVSTIAQVRGGGDEGEGDSPIKPDSPLRVDESEGEVVLQDGLESARGLEDDDSENTSASFDETSPSGDEGAGDKNPGDDAMVKSSSSSFSSSSSSSSSSSDENNSGQWDEDSGGGKKGAGIRPVKAASASRSLGKGSGGSTGLNRTMTAGGPSGGRRRLFVRGASSEEESSSEDKSTSEEEVRGNIVVQCACGGAIKSIVEHDSSWFNLFACAPSRRSKPPAARPVHFKADLF